MNKMKNDGNMLVSDVLGDNRLENCFGADVMTKSRRVSVKKNYGAIKYYRGGEHADFSKWKSLVVKFADGYVAEYPMAIAEYTESYNDHGNSYHNNNDHPVVALSYHGIKMVLRCDDLIKRYGCEVYAVY